MLVWTKPNDGRMGTEMLTREHKCRFYLITIFINDRALRIEEITLWSEYLRKSKIKVKNFVSYGLP